MRYALSHNDGVIAVRYPNKPESQKVLDAFYSNGCDELSLKTDFSIESMPECVFITYGTISENVLIAKEALSSNGESVGVILLEMLKPCGPIADEAIKYLKGARKILFVEEGIKNGGLGMIFRDALEASGFTFENCAYGIAAIEDNFASPNTPCDLYDYVGLSPKKITEKMNRMKK